MMLDTRCFIEHKTIQNKKNNGCRQRLILFSIISSFNSFQLSLFSLFLICVLPFLFFSLLSILLTKIFYLCAYFFFFRPHRKIQFSFDFFFFFSNQRSKKRKSKIIFVGHALYTTSLFLPIEKKEFRANDSCSFKQNREFIFSASKVPTKKSSFAFFFFFLCFPKLFRVCHLFLHFLTLQTKQQQTYSRHEQQLFSHDEQCIHDSVDPLCSAPSTRFHDEHDNISSDHHNNQPSHHNQTAADPTSCIDR